MILNYLNYATFYNSATEYETLGNNIILNSVCFKRYIKPFDVNKYLKKFKATGEIYINTDPNLLKHKFKNNFVFSNYKLVIKHLNLLKTLGNFNYKIEKSKLNYDLNDCYKISFKIDANISFHIFCMYWIRFLYELPMSKLLPSIYSYTNKTKDITLIDLVFNINSLLQRFHYIDTPFPYTVPLDKLDQIDTLKNIFNSTKSNKRIEVYTKIQKIRNNLNNQVETENTSNNKKLYQQYDKIVKLYLKYK